MQSRCAKLDSERIELPEPRVSMAPPAVDTDCPDSACVAGSAEDRPRLQEVDKEIVLLVEQLEQEKRKNSDAERKLRDARRELDDMTSCIEEAFGKANQMALKAEIASIELNQVFNLSPDAMWILDKEYRILRINQTFLDLLNRDYEQTIGQKCFSVFPGPNCKTTKCPLLRLSRGERSMKYDMDRDLGNEDRRFFLVTAQPFTGLEGQFLGIVEAYRDISDRKRAEEALQRANEELERLASLDGLTRIANRRRFDESLAIEWKRMDRAQRPLSIILCDIDFFKNYNDAYGHQLGDDCLRKVAVCLKSCLRRPGDLAARYGGEEFVALLPDTVFEGAMIVAESIREGISKLQLEHRRSAAASHVTLSLGVATTIPGSDISPESLIKAADLALYQAKETGRNRSIGFQNLI